MKTIIVSLLFPVLLKSCEGIPDQSGQRYSVDKVAVDYDADNSSDANGTTDAPIDGGIGFLLAAGAAYGVRRYRNSKKISGTGQ